MSDSKENVDVLKMYGEDSTTQRDEFLKKHNLNEKGLTSKQAEINIKKLGLNETKKAKPKKWYNYLLQSLLTPFNCILIGISIILIYTDIYLAIEPSYANIIVIAILVTASTLLDFFESYRSNKAAEKLREIVETTTTVIRDNKEINIPVKNVTLGDIVLLSAGSIIPADLRIIESKDLYVGQASLTGESDNIKKTVELENKQEELDSISDFDNICFMGTNVVSGSAKGVVIKVGDSTYFGKIANTVTSGKEKTAFQKGIESISKLLIRIMIFMIPIVFLINVEKHDIILAFTFSVAIAICITPLLLPVILSSSLSKGAVRMSKKKTIVKKLDSIQNFGAMNIFCTDKTGTLTEDKIVLEKYLNVNGEEDFNILKYAFLNAYLQTGLKSNIDEAVVAKAKTIGIENSVEEYKKIDEIPFDFSRRCLSVAVEIDNKDELITKGAVEEILNICTTFEYKGQTEKLTNKKIENMRKICKDLNEEGFRVVAICKKIITNNKKDFNSTDEKEMTLLGFIGFLDPPKESAKEAIEGLNNAGIRVMVLTGDNVEVTRCVCNKAGINSKEIITGNKIDTLSDVALSRLLKKNNIFAKLSPIQKARIVRVLKQNGNVVGYMGDGINDSPALTNSDVGISVDTAVDIAKETADIILLEKDLNVLLDGVMERKKNICKFNEIYKNGNKLQLWEVVSVIIASIVLPFLPETPIQLLVEGLLYDFGQMTIPFDNVDKELIRKPKKLNIKSLKRFMFFMGPVSSLFDIVVFLLLWFVFTVRDVTHFQTIWFTYSIVSNLIGMHIIRTAKTPFIQSNAHKAVYISSILLIIIGILVPFTPLGIAIGLAPIALKYIFMIFGVTFLYCIVASYAKKIYIKKYKEWI